MVGEPDPASNLVGESERGRRRMRPSVSRVERGHHGGPAPDAADLAWPGRLAGLQGPKGGLVDLHKGSGVSQMPVNRKRATSLSYYHENLFFLCATQPSCSPWHFS